MNTWHMRSVNGRIAADVNHIAHNLGVDRSTVIRLLEARRIFELPPIDIIDIAESLIGEAGWKYGALMEDAPNLFDCSSFIRYLYGQAGIWLPRRAIQQLRFCQEFGTLVTSSIATLDTDQIGNLVFTDGPYRDGHHACLSIGDGLVVCATNSELGEGVVRISYDNLFLSRKLKAVVRVHPDISSLTTFEYSPIKREIEFSGELEDFVRDELEKQSNKGTKS